MEQFGMYNGEAVERVVLSGGGLRCEILSYGATIRSLTVPDREGKPVDVVLGYDSLDDYVNQQCYLGAVIGPIANRIGGAVCPLQTKSLHLSRNDGLNCLHSGTAGLDRRNWELMAVSEEAVTLTTTHPDKLGGIPGPLNVAVTYWLVDGGLLVDYRAVSERDTLCNLTNHSYFNLDGHDSGSILEHSIQLFARSFTPIDAHSVPTGAIRAVSGTAMDLTQPRRIGAGIDAPEEQIRLAGGYDHNWVLDPGEELLRPAAVVKGAKRGVTMTVYTDRPGVQFYTGNYLPENGPGKNGAVYQPRQGLCLETQGFPDAPNHSSFPSILLRAGKEWASRTLFRFSAE